MKKLLNIINKAKNNQQGAALILMALALTVIVGGVALVTDLGLIYLNKQRLSNAIDAAALAGAQTLPDEPQLAVNMAKTYAQKNGVNADDVQVTINLDNREIQVQGERQFEYQFARIFGLNIGTINKSAGVKLENLAAMTGIVPLSIEEQELHFGEQYVLKYGAGQEPGGSYHSGWFGALRLGGNGANVYEDNLKLGYQGKISIGDVLEIESGNMSGPTKSGIQYRINSCTHTPACNYNQYVQGCPRIVFVPIVTAYGHKTVEVKGFGAFFLEEEPGNGNDNYVIGRFVEIVVPGESTNNASADYGVYSARLYY